jgi:transposase
MRAILTKEQRRELVADLPVLDNRELEAKYGRSTHTIQHYRQRYGIPSPNKHCITRISAEAEKRILELRQEQMSVKLIAERLGLTLHWVRKVLAQHGLVKSYNYARKIITPENSIPAFYPKTPDTFDFLPEERERYEELKRWKQAKAESVEKRIKAQEKGAEEPVRFARSG